jgi:peptidyl-prolyl cis-trans isomerase SurA
MTRARAIFVMCVVIAAGSGLLLFRAGTTPSPVSDSDAQDMPMAALPSVVATVDGKPIARDALVKELGGAAGASKEQIRSAVRKVIDVALIERATELLEGKPSAPSISGRPNEDSLIGQAIVSPEEVRAFWERHRDVFSEDFLHIRRISAVTQSDARQAREGLLSGSSIAAAPEWLGASELDFELSQALDRLKPGDVSEPVSSGGRYHVVQLLGRKPGGEVSFEDWAPRLARHLQEERWHKERYRWLRIREAYTAVDVASDLDLPTAAEGVQYVRLHPTVAARINGVPIAEEELSVHVSQMRAMKGTSASASPPSDQERSQVLARLIQNSLIREEAHKFGVQVSDQDLEQRFQSLRSGFSSDEAFDAMLRANATSRDEWRRNMREGFVALRTEYAVTARLPIQEKEMETYWKQNQTGLVRDRVKARRIRFDTEEAAMRAKEQSATGGVAFERLADGQGGSAEWLTHDTMPHPVWMAAWTAALNVTIGPVKADDGYWLLRVEQRQEAKAQTLEDHRDAVRYLVQRAAWFQRERARWVLGLMERADILNRFDVAFKLGQKLDPVRGVRLGRAPALVVVSRDRGCGAGGCDSIDAAWNRSVPLYILPAAQAKEAAKTWRLSTLPWTFAVDERGVVVGEYPGPLTRAVLDRLADLLQAPPRPSSSAFGPARTERHHAG